MIARLAAGLGLPGTEPCGLDGVLCDVPRTATGAVGAVAGAGSPFDQMTAALASAFARVVGLLLTFWTGSDGDPSLTAGASIAQQLRQYTVPLTVTTATIGVIVAGTRMAIASSRAQEPARDLLRGLMVLAFVWWSGAYLVRTLSDAFDAAGRQVLASAGVGPGSAGDLDGVLGSLAVTDAGLVFLLCLVGALSGLAQFLLLLLREPALALLAGALPVAAGASISGIGSVYLKRLVAWTAAFTAYTFVAAVIYAAAFVAIGTAGDLSGVISGIALVVVAVAALPAMIRLAAPAVQPAGPGRAGEGTASGELTTGALMLSGRGRQGAAGGPPSDAGPQTRPGLLPPTGSGLPALAGARRPALGAPPEPPLAVRSRSRRRDAEAPARPLRPARPVGSGHDPDDVPRGATGWPTGGRPVGEIPGGDRP